MALITRCQRRIEIVDIEPLMSKKAGVGLLYRFSVIETLQSLETDSVSVMQTRYWLLCKRPENLSQNARIELFPPDPNHFKAVQTNKNFNDEIFYILKNTKTGRRLLKNLGTENKKNAAEFLDQSIPDINQATQDKEIKEPKEDN